MKKKLFIYIIGMTLSVLTIITSTLFYISNEQIDFSITADKGDIYVTSIMIGGSEYKLSDFAGKYKLKLNNENNLVLKDGKVIDFSITKLHDVKIIFDINKSNGIAKISYNKNVKKINLKRYNTNYYFHEVSLIKLLKNNYANLGSLIVLLIILCILTFVYIYIIKFGIKFLKRIKENYELKLSNIIACFIVYFIINYICMLPVMTKLRVLYFIIIVLQLIFVAWYFKNHIKNHLQNIFVFFTIIICSNIVILIPPLHVPDEYAHYFKAYSIFNKQDIVKDHFIKIYNSTESSVSKYNYDLANPNHRISMKEYFADFSIRGLGAKKTIEEFPSTAHLNPFAYIPSAIVIKTILVLKLPFIWSLLLGRFVNALIFILLGYISLKIIPYFKKILFLIMLFPITIQQVTAINQDSLTLSITFIYFAFILSQIYSNDEKISKKSIIIIMILSVCLGMCKPAYFLFALLTLLIPKNKFNSTKEMYLVKILPFICCFGASSINLLRAGTGSPVIEDAITVDYALHNSKFIIKLILNTFYTRISGDLIGGQINCFGWLNISYSYLLNFILPYMYLTILYFDNNETKKLTTKHRLFFGAIAVMIFGIVYISGLFSFGLTTIHSGIIEGLQSRYFTPAIILLCISCANDLMIFKNKNKNILAVFLVIFMFAVMFGTIINGYYV